MKVRILFLLSSVFLLTNQSSADDEFTNRVWEWGVRAEYACTPQNVELVSSLDDCLSCVAASCKYSANKYFDRIIWQHHLNTEVNIGGEVIPEVDPETLEWFNERNILLALAAQEIAISECETIGSAACEGLSELEIVRDPFSLMSRFYEREFQWQKRGVIID